MNSSSSGFINGFIGKKFYILTQLTTNNTLPSSNLWRYIDMTTGLTVNGSGYIDPTSFSTAVFTITKSMYDAAASNIFDLENHMSGLTANYLESNGVISNNPQLIKRSATLSDHPY